MPTSSSNPMAAGGDAVARKKNDWQQAIGNACFRFRAISVVPVILLIFFLFSPLDAGRWNAAYSVAGLLIALSGALTRLVAVGYAKPFTSGRENFLKAENLNTKGLYSIMRNPLYVGNFLVYNGVLVAYQSPAALLFFNAFFLFNYYFIIYSEEIYLEEQFGEAYGEYRRAVPKVLPAFSLYKKNDRPFSLARFLHKEKDTTCYWVFFYALVLLIKQYRLHDGVIVRFWWHAAPVLALFALNFVLRLTMKSKPA